MRGWLAIMGLLAVMCGLVGALREQGSGVRTLGMQEMNVEGAIIGFVLLHPVLLDYQLRRVRHPDQCI